MTLLSRLVLFKKKNTPKKTSNRITTNETSLVIPVKDNQQGVNNYLEVFFATHHPNNFPKEIVVVDNNSATLIKISDKYLKYGLIKILSCKEVGPAAARNLGAFNAKV